MKKWTGFILGWMLILLLAGCLDKSELESLSQKLNHSAGDYIDGSMEIVLDHTFKLDGGYKANSYKFVANGNETFQNLKDSDKSKMLRNMMTIIEENVDYYGSVECGNNYICDIKGVTIKTGNDTYFAEYRSESDGKPSAFFLNEEPFPKVNYSVPTGASTKNPEDYNSKGEYKPVKNMTQDEIQDELEQMLDESLNGNSADYNSKGEYKPVEEMTQEEIQAELEQMLGDSLGQ
ncbi:MAG TPA: hypothetical protein GXX18_09445 [Bacillales bacterium]|nr:hypothetical protein [Bacillales bacterium]